MEVPHFYSEDRYNAHFRNFFRGDPMLEESQLGKPSTYETKYNPELLFSLPREEVRKKAEILPPLFFDGIDIWNGYELTWLNSKGKPQIAICEITVPGLSPRVMESKSLKLYLSSFSQTRYEKAEEVQKTIEKDISSLVEAQVIVRLITPEEFSFLKFGQFEALCLDDQDVEIYSYNPNTTFLKTEEGRCQETLLTNLFKSNCPVTGQPDYATVLVRYEGQKINHVGLLEYLVSFREFSCFHEACIEKIFTDIYSLLRPEKLSVYGRFLRRGGIDINPFRSNFEKEAINLHLARQ
jgi:7-cyano-7-deazaguanine reductase